MLRGTKKLAKPTCLYYDINSKFTLWEERMWYCTHCLIPVRTKVICSITVNLGRESGIRIPEGSHFLYISKIISLFAQKIKIRTLLLYSMYMQCLLTCPIRPRNTKINVLLCCCSSKNIYDSAENK